MSRKRQWIFSMVVILGWLTGFAVALARLGEASRRRADPASIAHAARGPATGLSRTAE